MRAVGTFKAKTRFSALLEQVARGRRSRSRGTARPSRASYRSAAGDDRLARTVARLKTIRRGRRIGDGLSVRSLSRGKAPVTGCVEDYRPGAMRHVRRR
jgi:hypothetical protein